MNVYLLQCPVCEFTHRAVVPEGATLQHLTPRGHTIIREPDTPENQPEGETG